MIRIYKEIIKSFFKDKWFIGILILSLVACFGFTIANPTMGIDDFSIDRYVNEPYIVAQGRWGTWLLYNILGIRSFVPFWVDLLCAILIGITALLICALFKKVSENKIKKSSYIFLAAGFVSFPIIVNFFVYQSTNVSVAFSNLLVVLCFMIFERNFCKNEKWTKYILPSIILIFAFACYEACFQTALVLSFAVLFIMCRYSKKVSSKQIVRWLLITLGILVAEYLINRLNYFLIGEILKLNNINITNESSWGNTIDMIKEVGWEEFMTYSYAKIKATLNYSPMLSFEIIISAIATIGISIYDSIKHKNKHLWWIWILMLAVNMLFYVYLRVVLFRTYFSMCVTFGIALLYINEIINDKDKVLERIVALFIGLIILLNTKMVNELFYKDYVGYNRDKIYYTSIIEELNKLDTEKPLLFVKGSKQKSSITMNDYPDIRRNVSELYFGAFGKKNNAELMKIFNSLGYNYNIVSEEDYEKYLESFKNKNTNKKIYEDTNYIAVVIDY